MATKPNSKQLKKSVVATDATSAKFVPTRKATEGDAWMLPIEQFSADAAKLKSRSGAVKSTAVEPAPEKDTKQPPAKSLKAQILEVLKDSLRIEVDDGDFTDPNRRTVKLLLDGKCISQARFDVKARREYEG